MGLTHAMDGYPADWDEAREGEVPEGEDDSSPPVAVQVVELSEEDVAW